MTGKIMFTGIVEETGRVVSFTRSDTGWRLRIAADRARRDAAVGDSIAVNGCCLTIAQFDAQHLSFDVLEETKRLTNFSALTDGARVNLERSLPAGGKIGGHFVTGHIDGQGLIELFEPRGQDHYLKVRAPAETGRYLVSKGSIAIDGMSLTVAEVSGDAFAVWVIPHTLAVTNLRDRQAGQSVNLEFDLLGKYVEKLLAARPS
jgi:riboflavin synthase